MLPRAPGEAPPILRTTATARSLPPAVVVAASGPRPHPRHLVLDRRVAARQSTDPITVGAGTRGGQHHRLAPLYDLSSTAIYVTPGAEFTAPAMRFDGPSPTTPQQWAHTAARLGVDVAIDELQAMAEALPEAFESAAAQCPQWASATARHFCEQVIAHVRTKPEAPATGSRCSRWSRQGRRWPKLTCPISKNAVRRSSAPASPACSAAATTAGTGPCCDRCPHGHVGR